MAERCKTCAISKRVAESKEPACCAWYLENVVILGKSTKECTDYEPIKE